MATTTNYGWTTPDDTALVKDGAAAIRTLGSSVDTTTKNLNPSTTLGDIEYRSSTANVNTRLPLGTAGQVLKVNSGATAPEWSSDNAGMTNPMTTTGDTIYSSSGSTPARLGIGTTGQVLTVAAGVPSWATPAASYRGVSLFGTTAQSIPNSTNTIMTFDSESWDTDGFHSTSVNTSRITIPAGLGGKYLVTMNAAPDLNGTGSRYMELFKNGSRLIICNGVSGSSSTYIGLYAAFVVELVATDYIEMMVNQDRGSALNFARAANQSPFSATYLGA
jgi:hypothetical protein